MCIQQARPVYLLQLQATLQLHVKSANVTVQIHTYTVQYIKKLFLRLQSSRVIVFELFFLVPIPTPGHHHAA
jgi:hypothetical protein